MGLPPTSGMFSATLGCLLVGCWRLGEDPNSAMSEFVSQCLLGTDSLQRRDFNLLGFYRLHNIWVRHVTFRRAQKSVIQAEPLSSYHVPFVGYLVLVLGVYNHKVGYPEKGVRYEPTGRAPHQNSASISPTPAVFVPFWLFRLFKGGVQSQLRYS